MNSKPFINREYSAGRHVKDTSPSRDNRARNWLKTVQQQLFAREYSQLNRAQQFSKGSKLLSLNPFMDQDGLIRVGSRRSTLPENTKYPIALAAIGIRVNPRNSFMNIPC